MSLAKAVLDDLKDHKCKKIASRKCPLIPYVPKKNCVQEMISAFKDNHLSMQIDKGTKLRFLIWHSGMRKAFLIHVGSALEAIKRKGYFKAYVESNEVYIEQHIVIMQAKLNWLSLMTPLAEMQELQGSPTRSSM